MSRTSTLWTLPPMVVTSPPVLVTAQSGFGTSRRTSASSLSRSRTVLPPLPSRPTTVLSLQAAWTRACVSGTPRLVCSLSVPRASRATTTACTVLHSLPMAVTSFLVLSTRPSRCGSSTTPASTTALVASPRVASASRPSRATRTLSSVLPSLLMANGSCPEARTGVSSSGTRLPARLSSCCKATRTLVCQTGRPLSDIC